MTRRPATHRNDRRRLRALEKVLATTRRPMADHRCATTALAADLDEWGA